MNRTILVICPSTIFGRIEKLFDTERSAMRWIKVCVQNQVAFTVEYPA